MSKWQTAHSRLDIPYLRTYITHLIALPRHRFLNTIAHKLGKQEFSSTPETTTHRPTPSTPADAHRPTPKMWRDQIHPFRESVKQVSDDSWLFGSILLERKRSAVEFLFEADGYYYVVSKAPTPEPETKPLPRDSHIKRIRDGYNANLFVWRVGTSTVELAVKMLEPHEFGVITPNHVTLDWFHKQQFSFTAPKVLYAEDQFDRSFTIETSPAGSTLYDLWPNMSEEQKTHNVRLVVDKIVVPMAEYRGNAITGVDGKWLAEPQMTSLWPEKMFHPDIMRLHCQRMGLDTSYLVLFCSEILRPYCIVVGEGGSIGVTTLWSTGYVPRSFIVTEALVDHGTLLRGPDFSPEQLTEYRDILVRELRERGFDDILEAHEKWRRDLSVEQLTWPMGMLLKEARGEAAREKARREEDEREEARRIEAWRREQAEQEYEEMAKE